MEGILDNLPVGLMMVIGVWPLALAAAGLPLLLLINALRHREWCHSRRRLAALGGFIGGLVLGPMLAFAVIGGGIGDLRYWLDWTFLAVITGMSSTYCGLVFYLAMPPR
jgi:uncharacterized membrane protein YphA (DoxX/SURF4 family)